MGPGLARRALRRLSRPRPLARHLCGTPNGSTQGAAHMSDRMGRAAGAPRWVTVWGPIAKVLLAAGIPMGFNGPHHSRPEERPTLAPRPWPSSRSQAGGGSGPLGRRPVGAQSARCRPRDHHRAPPERRGHGDRAGPDPARRVLSRHPWSARPRHPVRGLVHPHRRSGRSRRSGGGRRGSTCLRTSPTSMKSAVEAGDGPRASSRQTCVPLSINPTKASRDLISSSY